MAKRQLNPRKDLPVNQAPSPLANLGMAECIHINDKNAILLSSKALSNYQAISARERFSNIETNISVRDQFSRADYEYFRPLEAVPQKPEDVILACRNAYRRVGIIRNIIDLMADFGTQGIKICHPNPKIQKFCREWWKKVNGDHVSERFMCLFYREAIAILKRTMGKITISMTKQMRGEAATMLEADIQDPEALMNMVKTGKRVIPLKYNFLNPLSIQLLGGELAQFVGKPAFALNVSHSLKQAIVNPKTVYEAELAKLLPEDIRKAVVAGAKTIPLDSNKVSAYYYKKDDWQAWGDPMIYAVMDDLILLEKMKLADLSALDGAISQIRLWKLGDIEKGIFPTEAGIQKLADILMAQTGGGAFDLIWGPTLTVEEYKTNVHQFLGKEKYEPVLNSIFMGMGVPITLTGASSESGFTNNYLSLQTLVQRLEYGRKALTSFWNQEISILCQAMGFKDKAYIEFDRMTLKDEASMQALLVQLVDRGFISPDTVLERFGEIPEVEEIKVRRDEKLRKSGKLPAKAGPWHRPEKNFELMKIALTKGLVTPQQIGLDEDFADDFMDVETPFDQEMKLKKETIQLKNTSQVNAPSPGRPLNSNDKTKRKSKVVKPRGAASADFLATMLWAKYAQEQIAELVNPGILSHYDKKNMRSLTEAELEAAESQKFHMLCGLEPYQNIGMEQLTDSLKANADSKAYDKLYNEFYTYFITKNEKQPTMDEVRHLRAAAYSLLNAGDEEDG